MSTSRAWDEALRNLADEKDAAVPLSVASGLLKLLSIDNGRHVPQELADALEATVYRLAGLRMDGSMTAAEERLIRALAKYERAKWAARLAAATTRRTDDPEAHSGGLN